MQETRIRVVSAEPLRRRRLVVLLRPLLFIPQYLVLSVWSLLLIPVVPFSWLALLLLGRIPESIHRLLAAFVRYQGQATAWLFLLSAKYPDPLHTQQHPFRIDVPPSHAQPRLVTLLRLLLAVPAVVLASVFSVIMTASAFGAWFVALARGRTTSGLQELGTFCLRYQLEAQAYVFLLTARYPRLEPPPAPAEQLPIPGLG